MGSRLTDRKYKAGDRLGALYTYAVGELIRPVLSAQLTSAWSLLLPYHPDAYPPKPENERNYRAEIGKA